MRAMASIRKGALRDFETGTGFAYAKLSGGQKPSPAARVAHFVKMTEGAHGAALTTRAISA
jgi:hypothetical protein